MAVNLEAGPGNTTSIAGPIGPGLSVQGTGSLSQLGPAPVQQTGVQLGPMPLLQLDKTTGAASVAQPAVAGPVQPTVITSAPAVDQVKKQTAAVQQIDQTIAANQQAKTQAPAAPTETPKQELVTVYNPKGGSSDNSMQVDKNNLGIWTAAGWTTVKPTAPQTPTGTSETGTGVDENGVPNNALATEFSSPDNSSLIAQRLEAQNQAAIDAQKAFQQSIDQIRNGTFPLTPDQQAQLDGITNSYKALIEEQRLANQNFTMAMTQAGVSAGRNIYAPEIELGNIKQTVDQGIKKIAGLQSQMLAEVAKAKQAIMDNNVKLLDMSYTSLTKLQEQQHKEIMDLNTLTQQEIENARKDHEAALNDAKFAFDVEKEKNKPILEADKRVQDTLMDLIKKYPDSGVTAEDTLATATEKIKNSASYKAELAKTQAETQKALQEKTAAPTFRPAAPDRFGNPQYEQWNPATQRWDLTSSEQVDQFATSALDGTDAYSKAVNGATEKVVSNLQIESQRGPMRRDIAIAMQQGNPSLVVDKVKSAAKDTMGMEARTRLEGSEKALQVLPKLKDDIATYIANGGDKNIFTGTLEQIAGKVGTIRDAKLRELATEIQTYLMDYRRSMTGAAFSEAETNEYKSILPTINDTVDSSNAKIDGFLKSKAYDVDASYATLLGKSNWDQLKQMQGYENTIDRSEYDKLVSQIGKDAADKIMRDNKTWLVDPPKASAPATGGNIQKLSLGNSTIQVASSIADKVKSADDAFFAATGKHIQVNQSYRTHEQQQALYDKLHPRGARVARPGTSFHEKGLAIDVTNWKEAEPYLRRVGLINPMADDKGHFSIGEFRA